MTCWLLRDAYPACMGARESKAPALSSEETGTDAAVPDCVPRSGRTAACLGRSLSANLWGAAK